MVISLIGAGFDEATVLEMPLDRVFLYAEGVGRALTTRRRQDFEGLVQAIASALSGKGYKEYIDALEGKQPWLTTPQD